MTDQNLPIAGKWRFTPINIATSKQRFTGGFILDRQEFESIPIADRAGAVQQAIIYHARWEFRIEVEPTIINYKVYGPGTLAVEYAVVFTVEVERIEVKPL